MSRLPICLMIFFKDDFINFEVIVDPLRSLRLIRDKQLVKKTRFMALLYGDEYMAVYAEIVYKQNF